MQSGASRPRSVWCGAAELLAGSLEHFVDVVPVDQVFPERLEIGWSRVAVVDVIGMFPDIAAEDRFAAVHQRVLAVRRLGNDELAVLHRDPAPAGAKLGDAGLDEIFLGFGDAAEIAVDLGPKRARDFVAAALRLHP